MRSWLDRNALNQPLTDFIASLISGDPIIACMSTEGAAADRQHCVIRPSTPATSTPLRGVPGPRARP